jgi:hypothetical protein
MFPLSFERRSELKSNRGVVLVGIAVVALTLLACDNPTPTRTATPRPTFTPRPSITPTPANTDTPAPSPTPEKSATATRPPVATARPATKAPAAPTAPPAPQYLFKVKNNDGSHGKCDQNGVFQVKGRIADTKDYLAGINAVLQGADGRIVAQVVSWGRQSMNLEFFVSCFEEKNLFNYQLDATAARGNEPMQLFLTRSSTDLAPISPPQSISFGSGGRWYVDFYQ